MENYYKNKCRVCLEDDIKFYPLYGEIPNVETTISNMISYCTSMEIEQGEEFSQHVCIPCFKTIRIAYNFIKKYKETRQKLLEDIEKFKTLSGTKEHIFQRFQDSENFNAIEVVTEEPEHITEECQLDGMVRLRRPEELCEAVFTDVPPQNPLDNSQQIVGINAIEIRQITDIQLEDQHRVFIKVPIVTQTVTQPGSVQLVQGKKRNYLPGRRKANRLVCPACPSIFQNFESGFSDHILAEHKDAILKCNHCAEDQLNSDQYLKHFSDVHRFQCRTCNKSFRCLSSKNAHQKVHSAIRYKCNYENCTKSFMTAWYLKKHINTHTRAVKFTCQKCGFKTCSYDNFQYHLKTHSDKKYLCTYCGQSFILAVHLKYHMWKHTGDKYFKCKLCTKSYTSSTQLKKHTLRHHTDKE